MATVLESLTVALGLDASKFSSGIKGVKTALNMTHEEAVRVNKDLDVVGKTVATALSKIRNEALALLGIFTAGVGAKRFFEDTIQQTAGLQRLSQTLDLSARDLARWGLANKNAGGTFEGMISQVREAQQAIADFRTGTPNSTLSPFFQANGSERAYASGDPLKLLEARADAIQDLEKRFGAAVARQKAAEMGISEDFYGLARQGSAAIRQMLADQDRLADKMAKAAPQAEALRKKWNDVENEFRAVGVQVATALIPLLQRLADWLDQNADKIEAWGVKVADAIEKFVKWADKAAQSVGGWQNVLIGLIALNILSAVAPLLSLAAALTQVGTALGIIGGASAARAIGLIANFLRIPAIAAFLLHHTSLNEGEQEQLDRLRAKGDADFAARAAASPTSNSTEFAAKYGPAAQRAAAALGVDPKVLLGQWGLETGWGRSVIPGTNNLGNIKSFGGDGVSARDNMTGSVDKYRSYSSPEAFADDYVSLIKRRYPGAVGAKSAEEFAKALKSGGYAEDPNYVAKVARAAEMAGLSGTPGAANAVQTAESSRAWRGGGASGSWGPAQSTSEVNINGDINIQTAAQDAPGIAKTIGPAIEKYSFARQANTGTW